MFFKKRNVAEKVAIEQKALNCLYTLNNRAATRAQIVQACDTLLQCKEGLENYTLHSRMVCGSASAWVENDSVRIQKLN